MSEYIIDLAAHNAAAAMALCDGIHQEVVRCRDCEYMHTVRSWLGIDTNECWLHADRESGALGKNRTEPDGFCAWGKLRGDAR